MPKKVVPLVTDEIYHVYNRGVDKRNIFADTEDYLRFFSSLRYFNNVEPAVNYFEAKRNIDVHTKKLVSIQAYCLLPNHFHLLISQVTDGGVSEFMKRLSVGYTLYFNEKYERSGSLFQGSFKRAHVAHNQKLMHLAAYINYNHIVHALGNANDLYLTSRSIYEGKKENTFLDTRLLDGIFKSNGINAMRDHALWIYKSRATDKAVVQLLLE